MLIEILIGNGSPHITDIHLALLMMLLFQQHTLPIQHHLQLLRLLPL
jgi:hypothetical protein